MKKYIPQIFIVLILIAILAMTIVIHNELKYQDYLDERAQWLTLSHAVDSLADATVSTGVKSLLITSGLNAIHTLQRYKVFRANRLLDDHDVFSKLTVFTERENIETGTPIDEVNTIIDATRFDNLQDLDITHLQDELVNPVSKVGK
jgi:hypothetical protein